MKVFLISLASAASPIFLQDPSRLPTYMVDPPPPPAGAAEGAEPSWPCRANAAFLRAGMWQSPRVPFLLLLLALCLASLTPPPPPKPAASPRLGPDSRRPGPARPRNVKTPASGPRPTDRSGPQRAGSGAGRPPPPLSRALPPLLRLPPARRCRTGRARRRAQALPPPRRGGAGGRWARAEGPGGEVFREGE
ncbi:hypothetical protein LUU34_00428700 [Aix galericulata]|nr:hypothetical protein LUU34_00428700 [Aix galericulata]